MAYEPDENEDEDEKDEEVQTSDHPETTEWMRATWEDDDPNNFPIRR